MNNLPEKVIPITTKVKPRDWLKHRINETALMWPQAGEPPQCCLTYTKRRVNGKTEMGMTINKWLPRGNAQRQRSLGWAAVLDWHYSKPIPPWLHGHLIHIGPFIAEAWI